MNGGNSKMKMFKRTLALSVALVMFLGLTAFATSLTINCTTCNGTGEITTLVPCEGEFVLNGAGTGVECDSCGIAGLFGTSVGDECTVVKTETTNCPVAGCEQGQVPNPAAPVTVPLVTTIGTGAGAQVITNPAGLALDITNEVLINEHNGNPAFDIKGWAIGGKWSNRPLVAKNITGLMNKGGVLTLTDSISTKAKDGPTKAVNAKGEEIKVADMEGADDVAKKAAWDALVAGVTNLDLDQDAINLLKLSTATPAADVLYTTGTGATAKLFKLTEEFVPAATVVTFNPMVARDKAPKFVINYTLFANVGPRGSWTLSEKGKLTVQANIANLEFTKPADNKRFDGANDAWAPFPAEGGIAVLDLGFGDRVGGKSTYLVRGRPGIKAVNAADPTKTTYVAGTRASRVGPSATGRAPNAKPNYKANNIKVKANQAFTGIKLDGVDFDPATVTTFERGKLPAKGKEPTLISGQIITVRVAATAKRPASATLTILPAAAGALPVAADIAVDGRGRVTFDGKAFEGAETLTAAKWGKVPALAVPTAVGAAPSAKNFFIRAKADARATRPAAPEGDRAAAIAAGTANTADMVMTPTGALTGIPVLFGVDWVVTADGATGTVVAR